MADAKHEGQELTTAGPSQLQTKDALLAQAKIVEQRKEEASTPTHEIKSNDGWKKQFDTWANASDEERCNIVYGMVILDGAKQKDITRFFNIKDADLKPFAHIVNAGVAALKLKVQRNQISLGLQREDMATLKFHLGKQFAEQVAEPSHEGVQSVDNAEVKVNINVLKPEDAALVGEQVGAAISKTLQ